MWVVSSPVAGQAGKSFGELASALGVDPLEYFMDLLAEHDSAIRWKTVVTNDRAAPRQYIFAHDTTLPGFNDSGAHARNMAFQDGGLQMLQQVLLNPQLMPIEKAIHKLTGQSAQWLGLDAGLLKAGARADIAVVDPEKLRTGLGPPIEQYDERLHGAMRMVKRSDGVVRQVLVGGRVAFDNAQFVPEFGRERFGRLLRSQR
jgi:N-acyl-D-aspartate/D-glutamate deacylase